MLTHLSIRHFAIVDQLDIELCPGMTAITGETGAGKSIMLDAIALVLGGRADSSVVPANQSRAEISATVDLRAYPVARQWLADQQLESPEEEEQHCLLRRSVTREGRSQAWINGCPVTLQQLKTLGQQLVDIHSQHEHQSLLQRDTHRHLLDAYGACTPLAGAVQAAAQEWRQVSDQLQRVSSQSDEQNARLQLLRYQVEELDALDLQEQELQQLEQEQKQLAHAEELLATGQQLLQWCEQSGDDTPALLDVLDKTLHLLATQKVKTLHLQEAETLLETARLQVSEAVHEVNRHQDSLEMDPERLQQVEQRLMLVYQTARKHRIAPEALLSLHQQLRSELALLSGSDVDLTLLEQRQAECLQRYQQHSAALTQARVSAADKLAKAVNRELKRLNMGGSEFKVMLALRTDPVHSQGNESVEFFISTNPGQPFMPLKKVASGGELSRISLAIQVVSAQTTVIPTLIFDEVDVGIGGDTAAVVGQLLRSLGEKGQVICVTHQAAVAARAHQHWSVAKSLNKGQVKTSLLELEPQKRIEEVARMLGGEASAASCAHAEVMLADGLKKAG